MILPCTWTEDDDGSWDTSCGSKFIVNTGTPLENGMQFCCFCGRLIKEAYFEEEDDSTAT